MQTILPFMGSATINDFSYHSPKSLNELLKILRRNRRDAGAVRFLAGGMSLVPLMRFGLVKPRHVIDLNKVKELKYVVVSRGRLKIGAIIRYHELQKDVKVRSLVPVISDCVSHIGDMQVRNRGTVGGAIAHADPASDLSTCLLALRTEVNTIDVNGTRRKIELARFFKGPYSTILRPLEVITGIEIPLVPKAMLLGKYNKIERAAGDFAIAGVAVTLWVDRKGVIQDAGIAVANAGPKPLKIKGIESELIGANFKEVSLDNLKRKVVESVTPQSDVRGDAEYKRKLITYLIDRCFEQIVREGIEKGVGK